ncbi:hypothetical protein J4405_03135 [Candidatus Woesearchaeota archaeon]|nr:hypothetical protein [Candidatus Woesearchaeota archaeon]
MITTIQVEGKVKDKLDELKVHPRESYNDLIIRLLENNSLKDTSKESLIETIETLSDPETMRDIADALENYEKGEFVEFEKLKKELGLNV